MNDHTPPNSVVRPPSGGTYRVRNLTLRPDVRIEGLRLSDPDVKRRLFS